MTHDDMRRPPRPHASCADRRKKHASNPNAMSDWLAAQLKNPRVRENQKLVLPLLAPGPLCSCCQRDGRGRLYLQKQGNTLRCLTGAVVYSLQQQQASSAIVATK